MTKKAKASAVVEEEPSAMDKYVDALFQVLPCTSYQEIADKLSQRLRESLTTADVGVILNHLRRKAEDYRWTVPHVKRGKPDESDQGRFFAAMIDENGALEPLTEAEQWHMNYGARGTMQTAIHQREHQVVALKALAPLLPGPAARRARQLTRELTAVGKTEQSLLSILAMMEPEREAA